MHAALQHRCYPCRHPSLLLLPLLLRLLLLLLLVVLPVVIASPDCSCC
jgi:hypothetical protein